MRKITKKAVDAFMNCWDFSLSNTKVVTDSLGNSKLFLHGNEIAFITPMGKIDITLAGWNTRVTRERLNGIPGVSISTHKGLPYLNGNPMKINEIYTIT